MTNPHLMDTEELPEGAEVIHRPPQDTAMPLPTQQFDRYQGAVLPKPYGGLDTDLAGTQLPQPGPVYRLQVVPAPGQGQSNAAVQSHPDVNQAIVQSAAASATATQAQTTATVANSTANTAQAGVVALQATSFQGAYNSAVSYSQGASVDSGGTIYVSLVNSNLNNTPASSPSDWVATGGSNTSVFLGNFNPATTYAIGNQVVSGTPSAYYISLVNSNTGNTPASSPTDWQLISSTNTDLYEGAYAGGTSYVPGNQVSYQGSFWICISNTTGNAPSTASSFWTLVGTNALLIGVWSSSTAYIQNQQVTYNGNVYAALQNNTNQTPPTPPTQSTAYWTLLGSATVDPSTGQVLQKGSNPPFLSNGFTYTATSSSITWAWPALSAYRADGSVATVAAGTNAVTGLSANRTYDFYPYFDEPTSSLKWVDSTLTFPTATGVTFGTNKYVSTSSTFAVTGTWSVAFWAKVPDGTTQGWFSMGNPSSNGAATAVGLQIYGNTSINASLHTASGFTTSTISNQVTQDGNFHHVVVTYDGTAVRMYLDGFQVQVTSITSSGTGYIIHLGMVQGIAGAGLTSNTYMTGTLSRVSYWNVTLSSTIIGQLYQTGLNTGFTAYDSAITSSSGIVNYWKLIETTGTSAADSAGSNTGTYTGSPTLNQQSEVYNPVGSPAQAFTFPSFGAAQAQQNQGRMAFSSGALGATTTVSGSNFGSGGGTPGTIGGGGCFEGSVRVRTSAGLKRFDEIQVGDLVLTAAGTFRPVLQVHRHEWHDDLLVMQGGGLVTKLHPILHNGKWVRALEVFSDSVPFDGIVWNLTVDTSDQSFEDIQQDRPNTEHSYVLENAVVAHNAQAVGK